MRYKDRDSQAYKEYRFTLEQRALGVPYHVIVQRIEAIRKEIEATNRK